MRMLRKIWLRMLHAVCVLASVGLYVYQQLHILTKIHRAVTCESSASWPEQRRTNTKKMMMCSDAPPPDPHFSCFGQSMRCVPSGTVLLQPK